jgi:tetratricopeptide (TPR) repeat protein
MNSKRMIFLTGIVLLVGCASTNPDFSLGERHLANHEYDLAIRAFEAAQKADSGDFRIQREMGIACHRKRQFDRAIPLLLKAFLADTADGRTLFYLGTAFEAVGDIPHAFDIYRRYQDAGPDHDVRKAIQARLTGLSRRQMDADAKAVLAQEASINPASIPDSTLAVLYFRNLGKKRDLDPVQKGLADMLITDLSKTPKVKVLERVRMQSMLEELGLGKTGLVSESSAPRVGRLLGAAKLVNGTFIDLTQDGLRIDAGFVLVKRGNPLAPSKVQGKLAEFFRMEKNLVFSILDQLGISLSQSERDEIAVIPTENLLAFLAYCNGLDCEDKGLYKDAESNYQKASELDPGFFRAAEGVIRSEEFILSEMPVMDLVDLFSGISPEKETAAAQLQPASSTTGTQAGTTPSTGRESSPADAGPSAGMESSIVDQIMHTAEVLDQGFLPGLDSRKPTQDENQTSFGSSASFEIRVPLPQP